jgi:hypothetical protein
VILIKTGTFCDEQEIWKGIFYDVQESVTFVEISHV